MSHSSSTAAAGVSKIKGNVRVLVKSVKFWGSRPGSRFGSLGPKLNTDISLKLSGFGIYVISIAVHIVFSVRNAYAFLPL